MNREDIIRVAREAGFYDGEIGRAEDAFQRFAALVAAAEREKVAAWMIQRSYATGHGDTTEDLLVELEWQIDERIAAEREACARVFDDMANQMVADMEPSTAVFWVRSKAAEIRARGQA